MSNSKSKNTNLSQNVKLRLLYITDILRSDSDENHPLNANEIIKLLESRYDVFCDRKTVYRSIETLQDYGYDIVKSSHQGVFMASREFEIPELRLLMDAVQSADFISTKKTKKILEKLSAFSSRYEFSRLEKQVYIDNRNKTSNENLYYVIDQLDTAINAQKKVNVIYRKRKITKDSKPHYEEKTLPINPYSLIWSDDHYYLVGNYEKYDNLIHLRIDRIKSVEITDVKSRHFSEVSPYKTKFDAADYSNKHISMFSGESRPVDLICDNEIIEEVLDKFGDKITLIPEDEYCFSTRVYAAVNAGLVNWIIQYGDQIKVKEPSELRDMIIERAREIVTAYGDI